MLGPVPAVGDITVGSNRGLASSGAVLLGIGLVLSEVEVLAELLEGHSRVGVDALGVRLLGLGVMRDDFIDVLEEVEHAVLIKVNGRMILKLVSELSPEALQVSGVELFNSMEEIVEVLVDIGAGESGQSAGNGFTKHKVCAIN